MDPNSPAQSKVSLAFRLFITFLFWLIILALTHRALHIHAQPLSQFLSNPVQKFFAASAGLSVLIYLIILSLPQVRRPGWKGCLTIGLWSVLIVIGHGVTHLGESNAQEVLTQLQDMMGVFGFVFLACVYALFLALPFVAGVEIGLLIMAIFGVPGVLVAYAGTLIGLNLAFGVGRLLPEALVKKWLQKVGLQKADDVDVLIEQLVTGPGWLNRFAGVLLRNRYITLALCFNFPGNSLVGGGGGLSLLSGMSRRLMYWPYFLLVTVIATLPIPLLVLLGMLNTGGMVEHSGWFHELLDTIAGWLSAI